MDGDAVVAGKLDRRAAAARARRSRPSRASRWQTTSDSLTRVGDDARVGAEHAVDVGVDLAVAAQRGGQRDRGGVGAAAAQGGHVVGGGDALEAGHEHDLAAGQRLLDPARPDLDDLGLGVDGVGDDPGLRAGQRHGAVAEILDRHRTQGGRDALAGREQHVHLARVRPRRHLARPGRPAGRWSLPIAETTPTTGRPALVGGHQPRRRRGGSCRRRRPTCRRTSSPARGLARRFSRGVARPPFTPWYPGWLRCR